MPHPRFDRHHDHALAIIDAARLGADPGACMARQIGAAPLPGRPACIAVGKAAPGMHAALGERAAVGPAVVVVPEGVPVRPACADARLYTADHPLPTERSVDAALGVRALVYACVGAKRKGRQSGDPDLPADSIVILLSGGASALLTLPVPELGLDDVRAMTRALLRAGAPIHSVNTVRKHIDRLKGGRLAALAAPLPIHAFILSDVIGDRLDVIASGPVSPDPTTFTDALKVLAEFGCAEDAPAVTEYLRAGVRGHHAETPKPGDPVFANVRTHIIANNATALHAARDAARGLGFAILACEPNVQGEAREVGTAFARRAVEVARSAPSASRPAAILLGGETTVTVRGSGRGGRNQELALAAATVLDGRPGIAIATFSTDGVDGPTDAAGATVTGATCREARARGLDPRAALEGNNSHPLLDAIGALLRTGPTGTNVNDIAVALLY